MLSDTSIQSDRSSSSNCVKNNGQAVSNHGCNAVPERNNVESARDNVSRPELALHSECSGHVKCSLMMRERKLSNYSSLLDQIRSTNCSDRILYILIFLLETHICTCVWKISLP
ncbi:hypothetical protein M758_8G160200 [Ceratodon purpureus]|nr:hypothetical protein M758_8G160200 [Ceratodon purpureus]